MKNINIEQVPINSCSICKQPFSLTKIETLTNTDGLTEIIFKTEHITCRKYQEKIDKLTNEIDKSINANKFHKCYIKDLKQQKLELEWELFSSN